MNRRECARCTTVCEFMDQLIVLDANVCFCNQSTKFCYQIRQSFQYRIFVQCAHQIHICELDCVFVCVCVCGKYRMVLTLFIALAAIAQNNHYPSTENSRGCEKERRRESPRAHVMSLYATIQWIHVNRHSSLCASLPGIAIISICGIRQRKKRKNSVRIFRFLHQFRSKWFTFT